MAETLFDELGGRPCLDKVHKIFYDKLLVHPWLKDFFKDNDQWHLEIQQTEFMMRLFGGPIIYAGRMPKYAHAHMFITEEIYMDRHQILEQSLIEAFVRPDLRERWLAYDLGLKLALTKKSTDECSQRYVDEPILEVVKPLGYNMCPYKKSA
ncbi:MAG: group 1 truncated hemoglobin [Kordiimonadaceae bacterium]|jgi:hemoglobin|nr:group 1 truncated hemoglobin [Kordiimonadaceae bacterium]MBT6035277.1 group 1 truncated hemoglobin [Kordiimonadaceae bacterium]MBT6328831.1 group 1 truncated hemoglobin [Kordiimonadaceae bacterium]